MTAAVIVPAGAPTTESDPGIALERRISMLRDRFEQHIGYTVSFTDYEARLARLLELALRDGRLVWNGEANSIVVEDPTWESGVLNLSIDPGRRPNFGAFGLYGGRKGGLVVRNGPHTHNVYVLAKIDWTLVSRLAQLLHDEGRLRRDDALKLFVYMIPKGTHVVS